MPFYELLTYLQSVGDGIEWRSATWIRTRLGSNYVRSQEGRRREGDAWLDNFIWARL